MKNHRFPWLRNRTTDNRKCEKARNIKGKRTIEMFNTVSRPHAARRSSASAEFPFASFPREGCEPCNTTRAAMPFWQCGTGFLIFRLRSWAGKRPRPVLSEEGALCRQNNSIWAESPPLCGDRRAMGRSLPSTAICPTKPIRPFSCLPKPRPPGRCRCSASICPDTGAAKTSLRRAGYKSAYPSLGP